MEKFFMVSSIVVIVVGIGMGSGSEGQLANLLCGIRGLNCSWPASENNYSQDQFQNQNSSPDLSMPNAPEAPCNGNNSDDDDDNGPSLTCPVPRCEDNMGACVVSGDDFDACLIVSSGVCPNGDAAICG